MIKSQYKKPTITPPDEHPRLMLRKRDLKKIKNNLTHAENKRAYELWRMLCDAKISQFESDIKKGYYNSRLLYVIEAKAFEALIYADKKKARETIDLALRVMKSYDSSNLPLSGGRFSGHVIFVMSLVYDWLYYDLTIEERNLMIELCERSASDLEMNYPPFCDSVPEVIAGHGLEAQLLRDMLSFSIAVYDERPDIYDVSAGVFFDKFSPNINAMYENRMHNDGVDYGAYRTCFLCWTALIFLSMSGEHVFSENVENVAEWLLYTVRSDGQALRMGDAFLEDKGGYTLASPFVVPMFLSGALTGNENYRKYFFDNYYDEFMLPSRYRGRDYYRDGGFGEGLYTPVVHLIWNRYVEPKSVSQLPVAKYFGSPTGVTFYNNKEKETLVFMKAGMYGTFSHDHMDTGSFQIYHKGILASDSGGYHLFGSMHFKKYATRTIAHNCILIEDENEEKYMRHRLATGRDGGVRFLPAMNAFSYDELMRDFQMSKVISHDESESGCSLTVDMLPAYPDVCNKIVRKMTYDATSGEYGVFTVLDEIVTKNKDYKKKFLLHSQTEPKIDGNNITIENKGGRLVCHVIEPKDAEIVVIGGEGREFFVNGENYPDDNIVGKEHGWGRVEISPKEANTYDRFLVEMEIQDAE